MIGTLSPLAANQCTRKLPCAALIAFKVCEGSFMLKEIVGGSSVTVLSEETAMPMGTFSPLSESTCATVAIATQQGTLRMRLRTSSLSRALMFGIVDASVAELPSNSCVKLCVDAPSLLKRQVA